ncbi:MAG: Fe-S cluster assembly sulfur transfer protein SufU [Gemmatimonadota bacterium]
MNASTELDAIDPEEIDRSTPDVGLLYQELILDHFKRPRNKGDLEGASHTAHLNNPVCGDEIFLQLAVDDDVIRDVRFSGRGCSISQASISIMTEMLKGRPVAEAGALIARFNDMMHGDPEAARDKQLGNLRALSGVAKFPVRIKCALLGFDALGEALGTEGLGGR